MLPTAVRSYKSTDYGAPSLRGVAGDVIALLDACLVDGFGSRSVQSITRVGTTATATIAGHAYNEHDVLTISGAGQAEYNGTVRIFNVTTNTFDFEVTGTPATPATGTILAKKPGGGWLKSFTGTNKAAYRASDVSATRLFLRVDDTTTTYATASGYEYMESIDAVAGGFGAGYWQKSSAADTTARAWELVTDGFAFYLFIGHSAGYPNGHSLVAFGDIVSCRQGDAFHCMSITSSSPTAGNTPGTSSDGGYVTNVYGYSFLNTQAMARAANQTSGPTAFAKLAVGHSGMQLMGNNAGQLLAYPHAVDNALVATPLLVAESSAQIRGAMPGMYAPLHDRPGTRLTVLTNWSALPGRAIWLLPIGIPNVSPSYEGRACIDVTGPWR